MKWKVVKLGDILNFRRGHDLPHSKMVSGNIPVAGSNGIIGYHNVPTPMRPVLTIGRSGNTGKPFYYEEAWAHNTTLYVDDFKGNNPKFLYYLCQTLPFANFEGGSAVPTLNRNHIHLIETRIPENLNDQRRIASILSSLDRKIEINNQINARLEEIAQALFKSWFIDFEPFKDQKFVESEIGLIPEGWQVGVLGDLCTFQRGKNLLSKNAIDKGVPVVGGGLEPSCFHNKANTKAPVLTISGSGANAGFMRMYHEPVWASDCSYIDISCSCFYFIYNYLKINNRLLTHAQTGAVQPHVKPSDIHKFTIVIPDDDSIRSFQYRVRCFYKKIGIIQKENRHLASLRDTLLPKLMSGGIEIKA